MDLNAFPSSAGGSSWEFGCLNSPASAPRFPKAAPRFTDKMIKATSRLHPITQRIWGKDSSLYLPGEICQRKSSLQGFCSLMDDIPASHLQQRQSWSCSANVKTEKKRRGRKRGGKKSNSVLTKFSRKKKSPL